MDHLSSDVAIVVVGSCMIDLVSYAPKLPKSGETVHGTRFVQCFGGKGANQCVAAARLGATTALVAKVGNDTWGTDYIEHLKAEQVSIEHVGKTPNLTTGMAQICVCEVTGQNQIVIVAGANSALTVDDMDAASCTLANAKVVVTQLETSPTVAFQALKAARGISILNGAPAISDGLPADLLSLPTVFCVNETEAEVFCNLPVRSVEEAKMAAMALLRRGCNSVALTLGARGVVYVHKNDAEGVVHVSTPQVKCVDSTGAGDAFIGALAFALATWPDGTAMLDVLRFACLVAADSVTRCGTQSSFPTRKMMEQMTSI